MRQAFIIGALALGLMAAALPRPVSGHLVCSARSFQQYFRDLNGSGNSLSPLERLVFSLVMAAKPGAPHRG